MMLKAGKAIVASNISSEASSDYPVRCFGGNGLRGYVSLANQSGKAILIGRQGALCGNVCYSEGDYYATEHAVVAKPKEGVDCRYMLHVLSHGDLNQYKTSGAQPGLSVARLERVVIPVPSFEEQRCIAETLDRFDALVNDVSAGLPAEIAARRKQYEYYRDKLLTFKEKTA